MNEYSVDSVRRVVDGDTLDSILITDPWSVEDWTFRGVSTRRIRLINLDTPERGHPDYARAGYDLRVWLDKQPVKRVRDHGKDSFGRMLGDVYNPATGETATQYMLQSGWAPYVSS